MSGKNDMARLATARERAYVRHTERKAERRATLDRKAARSVKVAAR